MTLVFVLQAQSSPLQSLSSTPRCASYHKTRLGHGSATVSDLVNTLTLLFAVQRDSLVAVQDTRVTLDDVLAEDKRVQYSVNGLAIIFVHLCMLQLDDDDACMNMSLLKGQVTALASYWQLTHLMLT